MRNYLVRIDCQPRLSFPGLTNILMLPKTKTHTKYGVLQPRSLSKKETPPPPPTRKKIKSKKNRLVLDGKLLKNHKNN